MGSQHEQELEQMRVSLSTPILPSPSSGSEAPLLAHLSVQLSEQTSTLDSSDNNNNNAPKPGGVRSPCTELSGCIRHSAGRHSSADIERTANGLPVTKVSIKRYLILTLFCLYSMSSAYQWIHLSIIYDVIDSYYNESLPTSTTLKSLVIDSLSMVYMVTYIPLVFPAMWLLDKKGLRLCAILATALDATGAWLKCASVSPHRFYLLLTAQTICAVAQVFILAVPTRLAAVWFGPTQVSTATAVGVFGNQVGIALGFVLPPYLVQQHADDPGLTGSSLSHMFYGGAGYLSVLFILVVFGFSEGPKHPPSIAQYKAAIIAKEEQHYIKSLKSLIKNWPFMLLVISYGMNVGVFYGISTLLNPILLGYFNKLDYPKISEDAGWLGLTIVIAGLTGSIVGGIILDRTKHFKATTVALYLLSLSGMLVFTFTLSVQKIWLVYLTAGSLGWGTLIVQSVVINQGESRRQLLILTFSLFFMTGYIPVGFEFGAELTYPEPEGTSSGLLNASAQVFGIVLTVLMGQLIRREGDVKVNIRNSLILGAAVLLLGGIITALIRNNLFRQIAETHHQHTHPVEEVEGAVMEADDEEGEEWLADQGSAAADSSCLSVAMAKKLSHM